LDAPYTHGLAEWIAGSRFDKLPAPIVEHVKLFVLDTIGVGVFGASLPWSERLRATAQAMEAPGRASVWCTPLAFSAPTAAMINGTAVHAFELDDIGPGGHNGSVTLSSALAIAEHRGGLTGAGLINAIVAGIETAARVNEVVGRVPHEGLGFHGPGLYGTFASVASAASAAGLGTNDVVHALGHAGQQAASLMFTHHGGMGKRLLAGQAARAGTFAVLLAQNGFTNADNVFDAEYGGFFSAHTGNQKPPAYDPKQLTKDLGKTWHTGKVRPKMWACRVPNHGSLEAIKALRAKRPFSADDVKEVRIKLGKGYLQNVAWPYTPTTITSAQLNLYYVVAIMLLENDVLLDQFTEEKIRDPKVLDLIKRIVPIHDPAMDAKGYTVGNSVEVELHDGTVLSGWGKARGDVDNPVSNDEVVAKFRKVTARQLKPAAQETIIERCLELDKAKDVAPLIAALKS